MQTNQAIAELLSQKMLSVSQLAVELGLSRNAVHVQLSKMVAAGVLESVERRSGGGRGKPALVYQLAAGYEDFFSTAHRLALDSLLAAMGDSLSAAQRLAVLEAMGERMADAARLGEPGDAGLNRAIAAVNALGATARLVEQGGVSLIECNTCPLASGVRCEPQLCQAMATFFSRGAGRAVEACCERENRLRCLFEVSEA